MLNKEYIREYTYNAVVLDAIGLSPRAHDIGVVVGNASDDVDALGLQLGGLGDEAGEVLRGAAGCEGAWEGEDDDFLVGPLCSVVS